MLVICFAIDMRLYYGLKINRTILFQYAKCSCFFTCPFLAGFACGWYSFFPLLNHALFSILNMYMYVESDEEERDRDKDKDNRGGEQETVR